MILTLGALAVLHRRWLSRAGRARIPFALVLAGGVSALGVGVRCVGAGGRRGARARARSASCAPGRTSAGGLLADVVLGALVLLIAALADVDQPVGIAACRPGHRRDRQPGQPARAVELDAGVRRVAARQLQAVSKRGSARVHKRADRHRDRRMRARRVSSAAHPRVRTRRLARADAGRLVCIVSRSASTWVDAKTLMLTSPVVVLLAWAGVAALRLSRRALARPRGRLAVSAAARRSCSPGASSPPTLAQYHSSNLAPTARYEELASLERPLRRSAGPTLFTDFDEYSLYELRDLDVGGPDFVYPPPALAAAPAATAAPSTSTASSPAALGCLSADRHPPRSCSQPATVRLPAALAGPLLPGVGPPCRGARRRSVHVACWPARPLCMRTRRSVSHACGKRRSRPLDRRRLARGRADSPRPHSLIPPAGAISTRPCHAPAGPAAGHVRGAPLRRLGAVAPGAVHAGDRHRHRRAPARLDLRAARRQLARARHVPPVPLRLSAGSHTISIARQGFSLAPGNGGSAVLDTVFLTPARTPARALVELAPGADPRSLCGRTYHWIELLGA